MPAMMCWSQPTCDCHGTPISEVVYQVQRTVDHGGWIIISDGASTQCLEDPLTPPLGRAFWYRVFARAPNGDFCCEEGL